MYNETVAVIHGVYPLNVFLSALCVDKKGLSFVQSAGGPKWKPCVVPLLKVSILRNAICIQIIS